MASVFLRDLVAADIGEFRDRHRQSCTPIGAGWLDQIRIVEAGAPGTKAGACAGPWCPD